MGLVMATLTGAVLLACGLVAVWMAGSIHFDVCGGSRWGRGVALTWVAGVVAMVVVWRPVGPPLVALAGLECVYLAWWFRLKPSHDGVWDPSAARLPRARIDGDVVTVENIRNLEYRSIDDFTSNWETRTYHLSNLQGLDALFFDWGDGISGHPALTFDFGPDGRLCMSIEARLAKGQRYSVIRGLYRQHGLIFVAADERDIILRRTKYSERQWGHLYHLHSSDEELERVFLDYIYMINQLYETPRWYHVLFANCTTSFYQLPSTTPRWDWRVIANARLDRVLYRDGRLDRTLPFEELRRVSYLNDIANEAPAEGFGDHIRMELERRRHERRGHLASEAA